jgi:general secretion pathway protein G
MPTSLRPPVHNRRSLLRSRAGLTLIEIMVVIAILGTLMAIVAGGVMGQLDEANVSTPELQIRKLEQGLQMYAVKHKGKFPSTSKGLEAAARYYTNGEVPKDSWDNEFQYYSPGTNGDNDYEIVSLGADGTEGGDGTDADIKSWLIGREVEE